MPTVEEVNQMIRDKAAVIKDSGQRQQFASGMVRDVTTNKIDHLLVRDGPMLRRWAVHLTNGAKKYDKRNWMKAAGEEELYRFRESAIRHFEQWLAGETDEDHAAAVFFNINGAEYVKEQPKATDTYAMKSQIDANKTFYHVCGCHDTNPYFCRVHWRDPRSGS